MIIKNINFNKSLCEDNLLVDIVNSNDLIILNSFPTKNNQELLKLSLKIGKPIKDDIDFSSNPLEDKFIYLIKSQGEGLTDDEDNLVYSTTSIKFPCHTDGFSAKNSPDFIIILCIQNASIGGDSLFISISDIKQFLSENTISLLQESVYPSLNGVGPIFYDYDIRYNPYEIKRTIDLGFTQLSKKYKNAISELDEIITLKQKKIKLLPNQCAIINNRKILHGRMSFINDEKNIRLLKRIWLKV